MILVRSSIFFVLLVLAVLFFSLALLIGGRWLSYPSRCRIGRGWSNSVLWMLKHLCRLEYRVKGLENLPAAPVIYMSKHQSAWETISLRTILPLEQTWVLKRELLRIPIFGQTLALFDPIAVDRSAGRAAINQLISEGRKSLERERNIVIFPEGTRVAPGVKHRYGLGGALLAERTGAQVVPIAHNAGVFWARRSIKKFPGVIDVVIGPSITSTGRKAAEISADVEDWIERTVESLPDVHG